MEKEETEDNRLQKRHQEKKHRIHAEVHCRQNDIQPSLNSAQTMGESDLRLCSWGDVIVSRNYEHVLAPIYH